MPAIFVPPSAFGWLNPLVPGRAGRIVSDVAAAIPERRGLDNVATNWPDLRIWEEGPTIVCEPSGSHVSVPFKIPWGRHPRLVAELLGWPYLSGNQMRRHAPEAYRNWFFEFAGLGGGDVPATAVMYCTRTQTKGVGVPKDFKTQNVNKAGALYYPDNQFEWARVDAYFETLALDIKLLTEIIETPGMPAERQRNVVKTEESNGRYLSYAIGQWQLRNGAGVAPKEANFRNVNFWEAYNTIKYEWFDVLPEGFNHERNKKLQGKSNATTFDGKPPGTMMLMKTNRYPRMTQLGQRVFYVVDEFLEVPTGVNKALPPGPLVPGVDPVYWDIVPTGTTDANYAAGTYNPPYPAGDMDSLFKM